MTHNKLFRLFALCLLCCGGAAALTSCEQDDYDKGEGEYSLMRADFVEAHADGTKNIDYAVTDDDDSMRIAKPLTARWVTTADSVYRAILYYKKVGDGGTAEIISLGRPTTAHIQPPSYFQKRGIITDPVKLESVWIGKNRRYLNLSLLLMVGQSDAEDTPVHSLGVVGDTIVTHADGTRTAWLRLVHDQGGVPEYYSQRTYFCIPIQNLSVDSLRLTVNTYDDGLVTKTLPAKR
mgnify:CR=1 FL=1